MRLWLTSNFSAWGRRALIATAPALLFAIVASTWRPAAGDELQDYAHQCDLAIGVTVPDFDCDAGTEVPGQGSVFSGPSATCLSASSTVTCDKPNRLNCQCDPGSRFQVLVRSDSAFIVAHCRKE